LALAMIVTALSVTGCLSWRRWVVGQEQYVRFAAVVADIPDLAEKGCDVPFTDHVPKVCVFGDVSASTSVVLFGDSHAAQWFPAMSVIGRRERWKVITLIKSMCPSADVAVFRRSPEWETECTLWRSQAIRLVVQLAPTAILLGNYSGYTSAGNPATLLSYSNWLAGYASTLGTLQKSRAKMLVLNDTPDLLVDGPSCLARVAWNVKSLCPTPKRSSSINAVSQRAAQDAALNYSGAYVVDLNNEICSGLYCPLSIAGGAVYRDTNHLTGTFVKTLIPALVSRIVPIISASP